MDTIGTRLKFLRNKQSAEQFSALLGIHLQSLYRYERGERYPDAGLLQTVSKKTGVSLEWLICGTGPVRVADPDEPSHLTPVEAVNTCGRCATLEAKLTVVEEERQRINGAFIESLQKNLKLSEENGQLRLENLKISQRMDAAEAMCQHYANAIKEIGVAAPVFGGQQNIPASESPQIR